jgi:hypothetical protein
VISIAARRMQARFGQRGAALFSNDSDPSRRHELPGWGRAQALFHRLTQLLSRRRRPFSDPYLAWLTQAVAEDRRLGPAASRLYDE